MHDLTHRFVETNGIKMHYVTAGKGPLVVLLHGFPEFWYAWRHQIPVLAEHFQVVAPDLRGYGDSDKPKEICAYQRNVLAADIAGLIKGLGHEKAHIVGHDWGGSVAWRMAIDFPNLIDHLVIINSPHPYIFAKALRSNFTQMKKSWYIFFFQIPWIPKFLFKMRSPKILKGLLRGSSIRKDTFSDEDIQQYIQAFQKPGVIEAALNYYRAAFRASKDKTSSKDQKISVPTLVIWGENDKALGKELTDNMAPLFSNAFRIQSIPNCSHWVQEEQPETVNQLLLDFLSY